MAIHNKAIRDKIPEIIKKEGHSCNVKTLSDEGFLAELEKKLSEEEFTKMKYDLIDKM